MAEIKATSRNDITAIRRNLHRNTDLAVLGQTSDASSPVQVNDRPGYWWVRFIQAGGTFGPAVQVRGCTIPMATNPGVPVKMGVVEGEKTVLGPDFVGLVAQGVNPTQSAVVDPNANNPSFVNQAFIATAFEQIVEGTLKVAIRGSVPLVAGVFVKVEGQQDFTGNVPTSGQHCLALTAVLSDLSDFETQYSTAKSTLIPLDIDDLNEAWALMSDPLNDKPLWSWDIGDGITELTEANRWMDNRQFLNWETSSGGGSFYQTVQGNGTPATQEPIIDFIDGTNTAVTVTDDGAGTRTKVKIDVTGVTSGINQLTGDVTAGPGTGSQAATLATVNSNVGTFSRVKSVTANAKGLITAITQGLVDLASEVTGILALINGGTSADLHATGPGVLVQASLGAAVTVPTLIDKTYVNFPLKGFARTASETNINISSPPDPIGGYPYTSGAIYILLVGQTTSSQNGLWLWTGAGNPLTRPPEFASGMVIPANQGCAVPILQGDFKQYFYILSAGSATTIDTTSQTWESITPTPRMLLAQAINSGLTVELMHEFKLMVGAIATSNVSIATAPATIDGVALSGTRVLLTNQSTASQNGLWEATSGVAMTRPVDYPSGILLNYASGITVESGSGGTSNHDQRWRCTTTTQVTIDTDATAWAQIVTPSSAIPAVAASAVTGVLATGNIPSLPGSIITSGTVDPTLVGRTTQLTPTNTLINGGFALWNRQAVTPTTLTSYSDDTYGGADLWNILTQTASVQNGRIAGDTTSDFASELKQNQGSAQRFGCEQILEGFITKSYRSRAVRFQARIRASSNQAIRIAIVEWTGTEDSPTSDIVNDWTDSSYTTGHFFISTTTTVTAVSAVTPAANTWTDISVTGTISSSANNILAFIWTEGTAAQNFTLDIEQAMFVDGTSAVAWIAPNPADEALKAQRFLKVFYSANTIASLLLQGHANTTTNGRFLYDPKVPFRVTPTLSATAADWDLLNQNTVVAVTGLSLSAASTADAIQLNATVGSMTAANHVFLQGDTSADRYMILTAEL